MNTKTPNVYESYAEIKIKTQYQVLQWKCIGLPGKPCNNILNNRLSYKPKRRCSDCQYEKKKESQRAIYREKKRIQFLKGNVS